MNFKQPAGGLSKDTVDDIDILPTRHADCSGFRMTIHWLVPLLATALASCAPPTREPANLSLLKREIRAYADSGAYEKDLRAIFSSAQAWIVKRAPRVSKPAVVFDVDETVLSNLRHMIGQDWGYQPRVWDAWVAESAAPAIVPVREVYRTALDHGAAVFFITGRKQSDLPATARNLARQGMGGYTRLIARPPGDQRPAGVFKPAARRSIASQGYTIIANLGDQQSDLDGGHAERVYKLPNPFYHIP